LDSIKRTMTNRRKNETLIDETFHVWETNFGLWSSHTIESYDIQHGITGIDKDNVIEMMRFHLKHAREGTLDSITRVVGGSNVGVDL
jgi:hypothetical protein